jgi:hypothetical protein
MDDATDPLAGHRLGDDDVDDLLSSVGYGVLAMAREGQPYPVPLSFGYDGRETLYFVFLADSDAGRKLTYATESDRAAFLALEVSDDGWRSALLEGPLRRARGKDEWDRAREAMADNAWRPALFTETDPTGDPRVWALTAEERGGRAVGAFAPDDE